MDSPWDDDETPNYDAHKEVEWARISSGFTNAGYREGITRGKESALQAGFDAGFADFGAPIGRDLGLLRGSTSAIVAFLQSTTAPPPPPPPPLTAAAASTSVGLDDVENRESIAAELQDIASKLSRIRCSDVMPPDLEAEEHARLHLDRDEVATSEELTHKRDMEGLEDVMERMSAGSTTSSWSAGRSASASAAAAAAEDMKVLRARLQALASRLGLNGIMDA